MRLALLEAAALLGPADREPELEQIHAGTNQLAFEFGDLAQELVVLGIGAKAHDPLDAGAVVPAAIEQHDLAPRRQMLDVALEVPLPAFHLARLLERDDAGTARVEVLHEALDRAALACGVPTLEQDHDALAAFLDPGLQLQELDLEAVLLSLVALARQEVLVGISAFTPA